VKKLKERLREGGLVAVSATLPGDRLGAAIHGIDLLFHLLGPLTWRCAGRTGLAVSGDGTPVSMSMHPDDPVNMTVRMLFNDGTSWQLSPLETLSVHLGFDVEGGTIRRYAPRLIDRLDEPAEFKPGFLKQSKAFLSGSFGPGARPCESVRLMEFVDQVP
jgi:hypothetical protein